MLYHHARRPARNNGAAPRSVKVNPLKAAIYPIYQRVENSKFVRGVKAGTLSQTCFTHYITQDNLYLEEYAKAMLLIAKRIPLNAHKNTLIKLSDSALRERQTHLDYFASINIAPTLHKSPICAQYTQHLLELAENADLAHAVAATLPCAFFYRNLGIHFKQTLSITAKSNYAFWIDSLILASLKPNDTCVEDISGMIGFSIIQPGHLQLLTRPI